MSRSLVISPRKNLWHCLGACNAGGTVIDWVMRAEGVSFRHAVELLNTLGSSGQWSAHQQPGGEAHHGAQAPAPIERDADDQKLLLQVVNYYHETLKAFAGRAGVSAKNAA